MGHGRRENNYSLICPIYGLDRYVPPDGVWFMMGSNLKYGAILTEFGLVFPVCYIFTWIDRIQKLFELFSLNFQQHEKKKKKHLLRLCYPLEY